MLSPPSSPTSTDVYLSPQHLTLEHQRSHTRFAIGGVFLTYLLRTRTGWVGYTGGLLHAAP